MGHVNTVDEIEGRLEDNRETHTGEYNEGSSTACIEIVKIRPLVLSCVFFQGVSKGDQGDPEHKLQREYVTCHDSTEGGEPRVGANDNASTSRDADDIHQRNEGNPQPLLRHIGENRRKHLVEENDRGEQAFFVSGMTAIVGTVHGEMVHNATVKNKHGGHGDYRTHNEAHREQPGQSLTFVVVLTSSAANQRRVPILAAPA
mmetsp:Transcript_10579/g.22331  ORF Transcript_10579/g.22331 Transcript_10579/m.22331 type:complete len:202 (-) Transcript_10579:262-867(-)